MKSGSQYHHGDLAAALVRSAITHVRNEGASSFSLRLAAKAAGVTPAAVYRHFENREALLNEVALHGFNLLAELMANRSSKGTGLERFSAAGMAYVQFASNEPMLFSLMYGQDGAETRRRVHAGDATFSVPDTSVQIQTLLVECLGKKPSEALYFRAWGLAHGLASLVANELISVSDRRIKRAIRDFAESIET